MTPIEIYTTPICPFCIMAKRLLNAKGAAYTEINVMGDAAKRGEMIARAGGAHTVPQIFIGETHVGGCDELHALERAGRLDPMLNAG
ncbi:MAG: glutaredoxin 3 [Pseudomonadota bacterium]